MTGEDEFPPPQSAKYQGSFAYSTVKERMPSILTKAIDSLHRKNGMIKEKFGVDGLEQLKQVTNVLSELRYEMMTNKPLKPLKYDPNDKAEDAEIWDTWFDHAKHDDFKWFTAPWLEIECYMYRLVREGFRRSPIFKVLFPFQCN